MTTYPATRVNRHPELTELNERLAGMRQIVENVFGRLKSKFSFVRENSMLDLHKINRIIHALCIVYNMQTARNDPNLPTASQEIVAEERELAASSVQEHTETDDPVIDEVEGPGMDDLGAFTHENEEETNSQNEQVEESRNAPETSSASIIPEAFTRDLLERLYS